MVSSSSFYAALASTGFISLAPNLILLFFPQYGTEQGIQQSLFLSMGQALAAGGLLGDVFLHTLSHATHYEEEQVGLWILCGFTVFLVMDVLIRSFEGDHHRHHGESSNGHHHGQSQQAINGKDDKHSSVWYAPFLSSTVLLNMTGDALHNFTDGLAIGASFASHEHVAPQVGEMVSFASLLTSRGGLAAISILFHEIPHELGDYCILVKEGFTKHQAIAAQFLTAIAAFLEHCWACGQWKAGAGKL